MDLAGIRAEFSKLAGQSAWKLSRTHGSMFLLELGQKTDPRQSQRDGAAREYRHGEWHFLIECAFWRFETASETIVGSEDAQAEIDQKFDAFDLGAIKNIQINPPSNDLLIEFESGVSFKTFSAIVSQDYSDWVLYCPDEYCWSADSGGRLAHRHIREKPER